MSGADQLTRAIDQLTQACDLLERRLGGVLVAPTRRYLGRARARVGRGADHTLVALQGGTGSGKSSLFNALAKMDYSAVSIIRPTTSRATACVWGEHAGPLLDWLGIEPGASIQRDSVLEPDLEGWQGVVLVDLPDSDSVDPAHRAVADAVLPLADVLVWVTDPQKYADPGLLERFVPAVQTNPGRENVLVMNQIDTVSSDDAAAVVAALSHLLEAAGLANPVVMVTSAVSGQGVDELRSVLFGQSSNYTAAVRWLAAELGAQAERLLRVAKLDQLESNSGAASQTTELTQQAADQAVASLSAGVVGHQDGGWQVTQPKPNAKALGELVADFANQTTADWPKPWGRVGRRALASVANIDTRLSEALAGMTAPPKPSWFKRTFQKAKTRAAWEAALHQQVSQAVQPVVERTLTSPIEAIEADRQAVAQLLAVVVGTCRALGAGRQPADRSAD